MKMKISKTAVLVPTIINVIILAETSSSSSIRNSITVTPGNPPSVRPFVLIQGKIRNVLDLKSEQESQCAEDDDYDDVWISKLSNVYGCCKEILNDDQYDNDRPDNTILKFEPIGQIPQMTKSQSLSILRNAKEGWDNGGGEWTQMSLGERMDKIELFLEELGKQREDIVTVLMWEIGKNRVDAETEFDRTVDFVRQTMNAIRTSPEFNSEFKSISKTRAYTRRNAIGIILCLGPFNYPLNETYATLIPALLMGNVVIMKIPTVGGLAHFLTMEAFSKTLPPNTIHFISGSGRETMPPLMETGAIDGLAFIGGSRAADDLIENHPHPHRLKLFLQLEAKNMGILMDDLFSNSHSEYELKTALDELVTGALSFNGQRCTAIKIVFAPEGQGEYVAKELAKRVEKMRIGLPWQRFDNGGSSSSIAKPLYSQITPLPNHKRVEHMKHLIKDAIDKGAAIMNPNGGKILGLGNGDDQHDDSLSSTLMVPAVLYPVTPDMRVYGEEQFGPIVPVTEYASLDTVLRYGREGEYGQQVSIFTSGGSGSDAAMLVDQFSAVFGKININSQCGRSPDSLPFSGRRSSALGVMSVLDALKEFSVPTVVAYKDDGKGVMKSIMDSIEKESRFMSTL